MFKNKFLNKIIALLISVLPKAMNPITKISDTITENKESIISFMVKKKRTKNSCADNFVYIIRGEYSYENISVN